LGVLGTPVGRVLGTGKTSPLVGGAGEKIY